MFKSGTGDPVYLDKTASGCGGRHMQKVALHKLANYNKQYLVNLKRLGIGIC